MSALLSSRGSHRSEPISRGHISIVSKKLAVSDLIYRLLLWRAAAALLCAIELPACKRSASQKAQTID